MDDETRTACLTALWILHGDSLAKLLRGHGERGHAEALEEALQTVSRILSDEIGETLWREAMEWASDSMWAGGRAPATSRHH